MNNILLKFPYEKLLIVLIIGAYFIPNFYAIDRIGNQWFYLSIMVFISTLFLIIRDDLYIKIKIAFYHKSSVLYLIFIVLCLISILYSYNKIEALVTFNQYFTVFISFIIIKILLSNVQNAIQFLLKLFLILLFVEVLMSLWPIINDIEKNELVFRSMDYKGAAANINISSFSILYKIPILLYFLTNEKRRFLKYLLVIVLFSSIFVISILGTRGAYIGVILCVLSYFVYLIRVNSDIKFKTKQILILGSTLLMVFLLNIKLTQKDDNIISRASTIKLDTQDGSVNQRLRYYKQGLGHFIDNPIIGVGIGNWKLKSIDYDKKNIYGFIIPYHAHNDFVQLGVELGFFGLLVYVLFLVYSIKTLFKMDLFNNNINILLMGSFFVYLLDSMLNFPIARPISQLFLITFLCLVSLYETKSNEI